MFRASTHVFCALTKERPVWSILSAGTTRARSISTSLAALSLCSKYIIQFGYFGFICLKGVSFFFLLPGLGFARVHHTFCSVRVRPRKRKRKDSCVVGRKRRSAHRGNLTKRVPPKPLSSFTSDAYSSLLIKTWHWLVCLLKRATLICYLLSLPLNVEPLKDSVLFLSRWVRLKPIKMGTPCRANTRTTS